MTNNEDDKEKSLPGIVVIFLYLTRERGDAQILN